MKREIRQLSIYQYFHQAVQYISLYRVGFRSQNRYYYIFYLSWFFSCFLSFHGIPLSIYQYFNPTVHHKSLPHCIGSMGKNNYGIWLIYWHILTNYAPSPAKGQHRWRRWTGKAGLGACMLCTHIRFGKSKPLFNEPKNCSC